MCVGDARAESDARAIRSYLKNFTSNVWRLNSGCSLTKRPIALIPFANSAKYSTGSGEANQCLILPQIKQNARMKFSTCSRINTYCDQLSLFVAHPHMIAIFPAFCHPIQVHGCAVARPPDISLA